MGSFLDNINLAFLIASAVKIVFFSFLVILPMVAYSVYAERRFSAIIQDRVGPNRTGIPLTLFGGKRDLPFAGLLQPMADGLKFILKEDLTPGHVKKFYYWLAPCLTMVPALLTAAVIPFGSELDFSWLSRSFDWAWLHHPIKLVIADLSVGPLYTFAIASLGVYGIVLAGWSSNSKYPFLGGVRSSSQMISYEIALGLSIIPVLMIFGTLNLSKISEAQDANGWLLLPFRGDSAPWNNGWHFGRWVLAIPMWISFIIFAISMFAETNRAPFDLPECETELVAGYHTEYSSMKFALFFLGEYAAMIIGSGLAVTLFLGGWSIPFGPLIEHLAGLAGGHIQLTYHAGATPFWLGLLHILCFLVKVVCFILFFIWVRWTLPRFRYDQLMKLGWLVFFELALANVILTAVLLMCFPI
jgi:NADH-quinone oxidoreductase subunit H